MDARTFGFDRPVGTGEDHRHTQRVAVRMVAKVRDRHSNKYEAEIHDLSVTGFRADVQFGIDAGHIVWLTIPGMQGLEATVAWRRDGLIGCKFRQSLYPAVLDHIVRTISR